MLRSTKIPLENITIAGALFHRLMLAAACILLTYATLAQDYDYGIPDDYNADDYSFGYLSMEDYENDRSVGLDGYDITYWDEGILIQKGSRINSDCILVWHHGKYWVGGEFHEEKTYRPLMGTGPNYGYVWLDLDYILSEDAFIKYFRILQLNSNERTLALYLSEVDIRRFARALTTDELRNIFKNEPVRAVTEYITGLNKAYRKDFPDQARE